MMICPCLKAISKHFCKLCKQWPRLQWSAKDDHNELSWAPKATTISLKDCKKWLKWPPQSAKCNHKVSFNICANNHEASFYPQVNCNEAHEHAKVNATCNTSTNSQDLVNWATGAVKGFCSETPVKHMSKSQATLQPVKANTIYFHGLERAIAVQLCELQNAIRHCKSQVWPLENHECNPNAAHMMGPELHKPWWPLAFASSKSDMQVQWVKQIIKGNSYKKCQLQDDCKTIRLWRPQPYKKVNCNDPWLCFTMTASKMPSQSLK